MTLHKVDAYVGDGAVAAVEIVGVVVGSARRCRVEGMRRGVALSLSEHRYCECYYLIDKWEKRLGPMQ
jgi:hypothetical protein